ncbi:uncharacterized protein [Centruroides vittatus]|uniref:uncharacterized protein n=1 Tax=Centruroides vittatus TaxID=120091 RepID=UPI00350FE855
MKAVLLVLFILFASSYTTLGSYKTYNAYDVCTSSGATAGYQLGSYGDNTAVTLEAGKSSKKKELYSCNMTLNASIPQQKLLVAIRKVNFPGSCDKYFVIVYEGGKQFVQKLCNSVNDNDERQSIITKSSSIRFEFTMLKPSSDVKLELIITSYSDTYTSNFNFKCDNGNYISHSLTCDGHNNCGDRSDESSKGSSKCVLTPGVISGIVIGCLLLIALISGIIWCCSRKTVVRTYVSRGYNY